MGPGNCISDLCLDGMRFPCNDSNALLHMLGSGEDMTRHVVQQHWSHGHSRPCPLPDKCMPLEEMILTMPAHRVCSPPMEFMQSASLTGRPFPCGQICLSVTMLLGVSSPTDQNAADTTMLPIDDRRIIDWFWSRNAIEIYRKVVDYSSGSKLSFQAPCM